MLEAITLAIAVLGAVLGLVNTWHSYLERRVRLKIIPTRAFSRSGDFFGLEVINLSDFSVTIAEVGFDLASEERAVVLDSIIPGEHIPPWRLEPRTSQSVHFALPTVEIMAQTRSAYAKTACGKTMKGTSGALRQAIRKAQQRNTAS